jgi:hypothetical protein
VIFREVRATMERPTYETGPLPVTKTCPHCHRFYVRMVYPGAPSYVSPIYCSLRCARLAWWELKGVRTPMPSDQWKREVEHVMGAGSMVEAERQLDALDAQAERIEALEAERNSQDYRITAITADGDRLFAETTRLSERIAALEADRAGLKSLQVELEAALRRSDAMLSLLRHRAERSIPWGDVGYPTLWEVDQVIGQSRVALGIAEK